MTGGAELLRGRLPGWVALVGALAALNYAANLLSDVEPDRDVLYKWSTVVGAAVQYGIILALVLFIARGVSRAELGLRSPSSWGRAAALIAGGLVLVWVIAGTLGIFLDAGDEQGLVPDSWDGSRWAPFLANAVMVAVVAPVVEELTYRGLGLAAVGAVASSTVAIGVTGLAFGLAHGLLVALPVLTAFGVILGVVRSRTGSVYPCMVLHGVFNGAALLAAVTIGGGG